MRWSRGQAAKVYIGGKPFSARVHFEDCFATIEVGRVNDDLAIESTRTEKGPVEDLRAIRRREHDYSGVRFKSIHLHQQGVQGLLPLVVDRPDVNPALPADRVQFVDEDDARRVLFGLLEEIAHARGADPHEHLYEIGPT